MKPYRASLKLVLTLFVAILVLTACGGGGGEQTATATNPAIQSVSETPDPSVEPTVNSPFPTLPPPPTAHTFVGEPPEATGVDEGPRPGGVGTLVAVGTPDPELPAGFDQIILVRTGGPTNDQGQSIDETIVINRDGSMTRNGAPGTAPSAAVESLAAMIDAVNIFAVQANYVGPVTQEGPQPYFYQFVVKKGFAERLINAQDGLMPREIEEIVTAVLVQGLSIERP